MRIESAIIARPIKRLTPFGESPSLFLRIVDIKTIVDVRLRIRNMVCDVASIMVLLSNVAQVTTCRKKSPFQIFANFAILVILHINLLLFAKLCPQLN